MSTWEERMAAKAKAHRDAEIEEQHGHIRIEEPWRFDIDHPKNADHCRDCTEWRLYNPSAPWLGHGWYQTCGWPCKFDHDHHDGEVWFAGASRVAGSATARTSRSR